MDTLRSCKARGRDVSSKAFEKGSLEALHKSNIVSILALFEQQLGLPASTLLGDRIVTRTARRACGKQDLSMREKVFIPVRQ